MESIVGSLLPPAWFKQWKWRPEGCPLAGFSEHQAQWEIPDAMIPWLKLNAMASAGEEHWLRHHLGANNPNRRIIEDPVKLAEARQLHDIHGLIVRHPHQTISQEAKDNFVAEAGGSQWIYSQDRDWVWGQ